MTFNDFVGLAAPTDNENPTKLPKNIRHFQNLRQMFHPGYLNPKLFPGKLNTLGILFFYETFFRFPAAKRVTYQW